MAGNGARTSFPNIVDRVIKKQHVRGLCICMYMCGFVECVGASVRINKTAYAESVERVAYFIHLLTEHARPAQHILKSQPVSIAHTLRERMRMLL